VPRVAIAWRCSQGQTRWVTELRPTGRSPHQVAEVRPMCCPRCGKRWPRGTAGRVLVGTHKCVDHMHRSYRCQGCAHTSYDPLVTEGCRYFLPMGTPDAGWTG
jgi:hypothetical protein